MDAGDAGSYGNKFHNHWLPIQADQTIPDVKAMLAKQIDVPEQQQRLIWKGKQLFSGVVGDIIAQDGETETVRFKLTCELIGGGTSGFMRRI